MVKIVGVLVVSLFFFVVVIMMVLISKHELLTFVRGQFFNDVDGVPDHLNVMVMEAIVIGLLFFSLVIQGQMLFIIATAAAASMVGVITVVI